MHHYDYLLRRAFKKHAEALLGECRQTGEKSSYSLNSYDDELKENVFECSSCGEVVSGSLLEELTQQKSPETETVQWSETGAGEPSLHKDDGLLFSKRQASEGNDESDVDESDPGMFTHVGVIVKAEDTQRVLLHQRPFQAQEDESGEGVYTDPAAGTWEFVGGGINVGEDPRPPA